MSFTVRYSELRAIRDGEVLQRRQAPRITDPEGFETVPEHTEVAESTFREMAIKGEETDRGSYPTETWESLKGFKTWKPADAFSLDYDDPEGVVETIRSDHEDYRTGPLGYGYNIERLGPPYGGIEGAWREFWSAVSEHTEPFVMYVSPIEHEFADVTDFDDGTETVYYVEAHNGALYVERQHFARVRCEPLVTEAAKASQHDVEEVESDD